MTMDDDKWAQTAETIETAIEKAVRQGRRRRAKREREVAKSRADAAGYEPGIVTFIDILGFRAMLGSRPASEIHDIILSLREFTTPEVEQFRRMKEVRLSSRALLSQFPTLLCAFEFSTRSILTGSFFKNSLVCFTFRCSA